MGQKVWPTGFRVGVTENWRSRWYARKNEFGDYLVEDQKIRRHIRDKRDLKGAGIPVVEIEREREEVTIIVKTARPGLVIGRQGKQAEELKAELEALTKRRVNLTIVEVPTPELEAQFVAEQVAEQLKRRGAFRRVLKMTMKTSVQKGAKGIKIAVGGRLAGSEMARRVIMSEGKIPLQTLQADISFGMAEAHTTYGSIGVKVWIYRGLYSERKEQTYGAHAKKG
ncbi:MAG TPA: 30S ribosomal protein S3 [Planctomycetota bacterium]|jgi:small subunit ribosomal protein S3|nr:30S ribosomal protein S3 [Planctomycetota bacterium]OQC19585.1 MAG: 30S ribosomal protein S3 [Planctomycetes bacterium ADurb.Bin069]NMD36616.1 30S ribosomal protein S3 [Planctomycetota bacterium]HNR98996.1 30S ribosomal protein S3 [Planctomycetota bacterium]HNU27005.1 30S ribosomal protein S3 [Planctomycetota bacterium]